MKLKITILLTLFVFIGLTTKAQNNNEYLYKNKVEKFTKLKKTGITLGAIGGAATVVGIVLVNKADWTTDSYGTGVNYNTQDGSGVAGVGLLLVGIPLTITGVILGSIGYNKAENYQKKLDGLSVNVLSTRKMTGVSLTYSF